MNSLTDGTTATERLVEIRLGESDYGLLMLALGMAGGTASNEGDSVLFHQLFDLTGRIMRQREPK